MSAGFDTAAAGRGTATATTIAATLTVGNNANRLLVVSVITWGGEAVASITGAGATWQVSAFGTQAGGSGAHGETWYGTAPTAGSQTVTVNVPALSDFAQITVQSWYNADQVTPLKSYVGSNPAGASQATTPSITATSGDGVGTSVGDSAGSGASEAVSGSATTIDANDTTGGLLEIACAHGIATGNSTFTWGNGSTNVLKLTQGYAVNQAAASDTLWAQTCL